MRRKRKGRHDSVIFRGLGLEVSPHHGTEEAWTAGKQPTVYIICAHELTSLGDGSGRFVP